MAAAWDISDALLLLFMSDGPIVSLNASSWYFHLFKNDFTPAPGTELSDFVESDFLGYEEEEIVSGVWGAGALFDHVAITTSSAQAIFEADSGASAQLCYGYYVTNEDGDIYMWCERFETPRNITEGDEVVITPRMKLQTLPAS